MTDIPVSSYLSCKKCAVAHFLQLVEEVCERRRREKSYTEKIVTCLIILTDLLN
jgi:hypothetical protein